MAKSKKRKSGTKKTPQRTQQRPSFARSIWLAIGLIAVITFIAYTPVLNAGFVDIDDNKLLLNQAPKFLNNPARILRWSHGTAHWKPVTSATWALEYAVAGNKPFIYHFNNLLLHILNSILVFFLALRIAPKFDKLKEHAWLIALFTGLLFGVHPLHVESVAWVVERKDVLFTFFYLLGLLGYAKYLDSGKILPLALSALAYMFSTFSKAPGITMIVVLFLFDFVWQRKLSRQLFTEKIGHFGVLALALYNFGVFRKGKGEGKIGSLAEEQILAKSENVLETPTLYGKFMLGSMRGWLWYLHSLLPFRTSLGYPREAIISFFGPLIHIFPALLVGAGALLLRFRNWNRMLFFGHVFFFLTLLPAIMRLGLGIGIFMSDRYVYLPLFGLLVWLVSMLVAARENKFLTTKVRIGILSAVTLLFAVMTFKAAQVWKGTETLWTNVIDKYPSVPYAYINLASYHRDLGNYQEALRLANKGVELDDNANARVQRGLILRQSGRADEAISDYTRAIELDRKNTQALVNRGNAYLDRRQFQLAINDYDLVLDRERNPKAAVNRAIAYAQLGQFQKAEESFALGEKFHRNNPDLYLNRAIMYFQAQQLQQALADYQFYLSLVPDDHQIWNDMGIVYQNLNRHDKALECLNRAISIQPFSDYYMVRARSYDAMGNSQAAQADRNTARQIQ